MSPTARRPASARGRILAVAGAVAALAGAGTAAASAASAAVVPSPATAAAQPPAVLTGNGAPAVLTGAGGPLLAATPAPHAAPATHATVAPVVHAAAAQTPAVVSHGAAVPAAAPAVHASGGSGSAHAASGHTSASAVHHTQPRRETFHAASPARPYEMYDSVTPSAIPGGKAVATYADGPYAAAPSQMTGRSSVTWIDTNGSDPKGANALDVEPGDATPQMAATWAGQRLDDHPHGIAVIYTMRSDWAATQAAISGLPKWQQHDVRYWIADPTGVPHLVPGSSATQWYWGTNYDISTVAPGF